MRIHAIQTGSVRIKSAQIEARLPDPLRLVGVFVDRQWSDWLPTYAWAIEHPEGVIVVDTGQSARLMREAHEALHPFVRWEAAFQIAPEEEIGAQLKALGIGTRDVKRVVLTHMHMDHDAGLADFPHSEVLVSRTELAQAKGVAGLVRGYLPNRWPSGFAPTAIDLDHGAYGPFTASRRLNRIGDVVAVATPGHTAGHISVIVEDGDTAVMLAGDTSYTQALMLAGRIDGVSTDGVAAGRGMAAIRTFAQQRPLVYLPTHDPDSGRRLALRETVFSSRVPSVAA